MGVSAWTGALVDWGAEFEALKRHMAPVFGRGEPRLAAGAFISGVLSSAERKTGWMLAEQARMGRPCRIQLLLGRSSWSADALRDRVRDCVTRALCDPAGVLVIDGEPIRRTGF